VIEANPLAARVLGLSRNELVGTKLQMFEETSWEGAGPSLTSFFSSSNWQLDGRVLKTRALRKSGAGFSAEFVFRSKEVGPVYLARDVTGGVGGRWHASSCAWSSRRPETNLWKPCWQYSGPVGHQMPGSYCGHGSARDRLIPAGARKYRRS
jgi:hypothetical protein